MTSKLTIQMSQALAYQWTEMAIQMSQAVSVHTNGNTDVTGGISAHKWQYRCHRRYQCTEMGIQMSQALAYQCTQMAIQVSQVVSVHRNGNTGVTGGISAHKWQYRCQQALAYQCTQMAIQVSQAVSVHTNGNTGVTGASLSVHRNGNTGVTGGISAQTSVLSCLQAECIWPC